MGDQQDLHYGSLGKVSYSADSASWVCERLPAQLSRTEVLRRDFSIKDKSHGNVGSSRLDLAVEDKAHVRLLADDLPELAGAIPTVQHVIQVDRRIDDPVTQPNDGYAGQLLAFGVARGLRYASNTPLRVVAYPAGRNRNDLHVAQMMPVTSSIDMSDNSSVAVQSMRVVPSSSPTWHCTSGAILQVIFSDAKEDAHMLLAVRSSTCLHLLRPRATKTPVKEGNRRSRIHAHVMAAEKLVDIRIPRLLESACTDAAFNPWYQQQLVVVDDNGLYAIVQLTSRKTRAGLYNWTVLSSGRVGTQDKKHVRRPHFFRVIWFHDVHTFVIGGGNSVFLLDARNSQSALAHLSASSYVVDIGRSPFYRHDIFVLTSSHIEWLRVSTSLDGGSTITRLTSWRHYLEPCQAGIKLSFCQQDGDSETGSVLIYSRNAFLVAEFPLPTASDVSHQHWITCQPSSFHCPTSVKLPSRALDMELHAVPLVSDGFKHDFTTLHMYQLFILDSYSSLTAYFCSKKLQSSDQTGVNLAAVARRRRWEGNVRRRDVDEWLVSDDTSGASGIDADNGSTSSKHSSVVNASEKGSMSSHKSTTMHSAHDTRGISYADVYNELVAKNSQPEADLLTEISRMLSDELQTSQNIYMAEHIDTQAVINDLDRSTSLLEATVHQSDGGMFLPENSKLQKMSLPNVDHLSFLVSESLALSDMYDSIVQSWISPLSENVPARTRIRLEQNARSMTAGLWLSSHCIVNEAASSQVQDQVTAAPDRVRATSEQPLREFKHLSLSSQSGGPSQSQDTVNSSQRDSRTPSRAGTPSVASEADISSAAAFRLSRYTAITRPPPTSDLTAGVLGHWAEGTDPKLYDYKSEVAAARGTINVAGSQMSAETYSRQRRKAKRHEERRQQREMRRLALSSVPPSSTFSQTSSQPGFASGRQQSDRLWQSSQPVMMPEVNSSQPSNIQHLDMTQGGPADSSQELQMASQVQPGRHGARPLPGSLAVRAKNKRKAGF